MKQIYGRQRAGAQRVFRGFYAPASLKLPKECQYTPSYSSFPGFLCPGLIEARQSRAGLPRQSLVFRGFYAPASLKQGALLETTSGIRDCFPGFLCPGLIEAASWLTSPRHASLVFRGFYAPASLKQWNSWRRTNLGGRFPGFLCPGLIEAQLRRQCRT